MRSDSGGGHNEVAVHSDTTNTHLSGWNVAAACIEPLYNLTVGASEVVLTIDLPYVNSKQVRISCLSNDELELYAETIRKITFEDLGMKHRHGEFTCYHARIRTPVAVDDLKMKTHFKRGVLVVHIPRSRKATP